MSILVTPEAAEQLKRAHADSQLGENTFVRVGVVAGGCSGFEYAMNFDDQFDEAKDTKYEQNGISVVVDKKSALLLDGTTLDWYSSLERSGFTFNNPNVVESLSSKAITATWRATSKKILKAEFSRKNSAFFFSPLGLIVSRGTANEPVPRK
jgi:iron-sulfur cluster assembly protein